MIYPYTKTEQTKQRIKNRSRIVSRLDSLSRENTKRRAMKEHKGCQCYALMNIPGVTRVQPVRRWQDLEWAHCKSRNKHSVRWDEDNVAGLDGLCHKFLDAHPKVKEEFFRKLKGDEAIDELIRRAENVILRGEDDYQLIETYLKQRVKMIKGDA